jgi:hypothetical protein
MRRSRIRRERNEEVVTPEASVVRMAGATRDAVGE